MYATSPFGLSRAEKEAILVPPKTQEVFIGMVIGYLEWLTRAEKEAIVVPATIKEHSAVKSAIYYWRNFSIVLILHFLIVLPSCLLITPPSKYRGPHDSISYSLLASGGLA